MNIATYHTTSTETSAVPKPLINLRQICILSPAVLSILQRAQAIRNPDWRDFERLKRQLSCHVGWRAKLTVLGTSEAYVVAIEKLTDLLGL